MLPPVETSLIKNNLLLNKKWLSLTVLLINKRNRKKQEIE